ncbi:MATE family efflux transporter [Streptomyces litchfieldiae]|uniref:Multidrug export protein MepA n=1 Tax=Streptomyces litchfieldiae TaxID=3075543 RepID=A0ABU2MZK1_9ACTN|nr:MATE family efflux transporter [Streptomyces sp. DSM 44938]MDT0346936.1 MATE family efflux transporter [Streptomyces sp. DSM 44938]
MRDHTSALGTRPVGRLLWSTSAHTTMSVATYGIYALTNAWFVSRGVGPEALVAVNVVSPVLLILGAVSTTVGVGGASMVSRSLGSGNPRQAARAAGNTFLVYWTTAIAITLLGLLLLDPLLTLLGARGDVRGHAHDYALIMLAGAITATGFSSLVRAEGRLRFSALLWMLPVLCQIALDPLLIFGLGWGVRGAALGTVGGQAVSMGLSLWFFFLQRDRPYRITLADLRPHGPTLRELVAVGTPSFLGGFGNTLIMFIANNRLAALGDPAALGAYATSIRVTTFVLMPQTGIAQGMQPLIGYNAGRGLIARAERTRVLALRATVLYGTAACLVLLAVADPLAAAFTDDPATRRATAEVMRVVALGYPFAGVTALLATYFQARGRARPSFVISVGSILAVHIPLLLALGLFGTPWLWISFPAAALLSAAGAILILRRTTPAESSRVRDDVTRGTTAPAEPATTNAATDAGQER